MSDTQKALQQIVDHCAQEIDRVTDWKERTNTERGSHRYSYNEGREETSLRIGYYILGVAEKQGLTIDTTKLFTAEEGTLQ